MTCPDCQGELNKDPRNGEGIWTCKVCGFEWFILKIPKQKIFKRKGEEAQ